MAGFELGRILIALSASFGWKRLQIDVKGTFLLFYLPKDTDIWIRLPKINEIPATDGFVVKLVKALYGLRKTPMLWYQTLSSRLIQIGCKRIVASDFLFILRRNNAMLIVLIYVDDLGIFGDLKLINFMKKKLENFFQLTDLGE